MDMLSKFKSRLYSIRSKPADEEESPDQVISEDKSSEDKSSDKPMDDW